MSNQTLQKVLDDLIFYRSAYGSTGNTDAVIAELRANLAPIEAIDTSPERVRNSAGNVHEPDAWLYFHNRQDTPLGVQLEEPDCIKSFDTDVTWKRPLYLAPPDAEALRKELEEVKANRALIVKDLCSLTKDLM